MQGSFARAWLYPTLGFVRFATTEVKDSWGLDREKLIYVRNVCSLHIITLCIVPTCPAQPLKSQTLEFSCAAAAQRLPCLIPTPSEVPFPFLELGYFCGRDTAAAPAMRSSVRRLREKFGWIFLRQDLNKTQ